MELSWEERIAQFWSTADDSQPHSMLDAMGMLVGEGGRHDPDAIYEWASVQDFLGRESDAIPLYRSALSHGLSGARRPQAVLQLASSLRNVGHADEAVELLSSLDEDAVVGAARQAFLALALRDAGRHDEALKVALLALAPTLTLYGRVISSYAEELTAGQTD